MSIRRLIQVAGGLALGLVAIPPAVLQAQAKNDVKSDSKWIREVAADNKMEVDLAQIAQHRATNSAVKQFADRMVTDHTKANDELLSMAKSHGFSFEPGLGSRHEQKVDQLQKVHGKEFDRAYIRSMIENHAADVSYFQDEGLHAKSAPVRDYAAKFLPELQQHLAQAKQIGSQIGADTAVTTHARKTTTRK